MDLFDSWAAWNEQEAAWAAEAARAAWAAEAARAARERDRLALLVARLDAQTAALEGEMWRMHAMRQPLTLAVQRSMLADLRGRRALAAAELSRRAS